ncbi:MAG: polysaccharide pyruvyl transferase family protein [Alteraurantiacibacter sp. bin_em_oilr2.035]|nr:polysaccharide pyruvyl transferase family protein [Alteraurantiacibacter sp. bin_em_oilr2.035]
MSERRVALIHAFSRANAGDGLLVDLTYEALADAGIERDECLLMALDPDSFSDIANVIRAPGEPTARPSLKLLDAGREAISSLAGFGQVRAKLRHVDALIAVGGGYLVADSPIRQAGVIANHLAQLRAAAAHGAQAIYLPQSIGPLCGIAGHWTRESLARMDRIWARDDVTLRELALANIRRCPDLAVMKLARSFAEIERKPSAGAPVLVARDLPDSGEYYYRLANLYEMLPDAAWAVQADIPGPRSDQAFYRRLGFGEAPSLAKRLTQPSGPVVSVRLHGAIGALLSGRPVIHLAYERKGWGAFEDLGLTEFVHDARHFDPRRVVDQVRDLTCDPARYWNQVMAAQKQLLSAWDMMVSDLAARIPPASHRKAS